MTEIAVAIKSTAWFQLGCSLIFCSQPSTGHSLQTVWVQLWYVHECVFCTYWPLWVFAPAMISGFVKPPSVLLLHELVPSTKITHNMCANANRERKIHVHTQRNINSRHTLLPIRLFFTLAHSFHKASYCWRNLVVSVVLATERSHKHMATLAYHPVVVVAHQATAVSSVLHWSEKHQD